MSLFLDNKFSQVSFERKTMVEYCSASRSTNIYFDEGKFKFHHWIFLERREVSFGSATFSTSDKLEVIGSSGRIPSAQKSHHEILENEIIEEVLMLLARLDHERLRLMNSCERERENRERLKNNIDQWRLKRLHDLPLAVQKGFLIRVRLKIHQTNSVFRT